MKRIISLFVFTVTATMATADDRISLWDDDFLVGRVQAAAIGEALIENCDRVTPRRVKVLSELMAVRRRASELGYSRSEMTAFVKNRDNRARVYAARDQYFAQNGVVSGQAGTYCALAEQEVADGSFIGSLIRID